MINSVQNCCIPASSKSTDLCADSYCKPGRKPGLSKIDLMEFGFLLMIFLCANLMCGDMSTCLSVIILLVAGTNPPLSYNNNNNK